MHRHRVDERNVRSLPLNGGLGVRLPFAFRNGLSYVFSGGYSGPGTIGIVFARKQ